MLLEGLFFNRMLLNLIPLPGYNKIDKVNKKVSDMERMMRELKESNERMMKTINKHFAQLPRSNRERGTFPSQSKLNPK